MWEFLNQKYTLNDIFNGTIVRLEQGGKTENDDFEDKLDFKKEEIPKIDFSYLNNITKEDIQDVLSGKRKVVHGDPIQGSLTYLRRNESSSSLATESNTIKHQEGRKTHKPDYLKDLGNISYEQFKDIQKRSPNVSFLEMNQAGAYLLLKQRPVTLEEMRAQVLRVAIGSDIKREDYEIRRSLEMWFPNSTQEQTEKDFNEIKHIISKGNKINTNIEIARYLERKKGISEKDSKIIEEDYSVYFSQSKLLYIWNFYRGDFDRVKNEDFNSNDNLIVKSEWLSDKESAEKVVQDKNKWSTYKGRVYISKKEMEKGGKIYGKDIVDNNKGISRSEDGSSFIRKDDEFELKEIDIKDVNFDPKLTYEWYVKKDLDEDIGIINGLVKKIESGIELNPIALDSDYKILDGFHRLIAYRKLKIPKIKVYVKTNQRKSLASFMQSKASGGKVLLAPNGKPSNLNTEQYKLVRAPEFKKWFGNWEAFEKAKSIGRDIKGIYKNVFNDNAEKVLFEIAVQANSGRMQNNASVKMAGEEFVRLALELYPDVKIGDAFYPVVSKVVDSNGEPLIVHHTTDKDFFVFDKRRSREGFFFSPNKERLSVYNKSKNSSFFLNIKNPSHELFKTDLKYLIPKGYDGIMDYGHAPKSNEDLYEIIAFYPNQVKLADGTNKTFDGNNPDIRYKQGGKAIPISDLVTKDWKLEKVKKDIKKGRISKSKDKPLIVSYRPNIKKFLVKDGNHRTLEKSNDGETIVNAIIISQIENIDDSRLVLIAKKGAKLDELGYATHIDTKDVKPQWIKDTGLSKEAFTWLHNWSWENDFWKDKHGNYKIPTVPSDVEKELSKYRPKETVILYRGTKDTPENEAKKKYRSFSYELGYAEAVAEVGEFADIEDKGGRVITSNITPDKILVDITKIPHFEDYFTNEVIVRSSN